MLSSRKYDLRAKRSIEWALAINPSLIVLELRAELPWPANLQFLALRQSIGYSLPPASRLTWLTSGERQILMGVMIELSDRRAKLRALLARQLDKLDLNSSHTLSGMDPSAPSVRL